MTTDGSAVLHEVQTAADNAVNEHDTLKYHLLGPSLTKAGQDSVDQQKVLTIQVHVVHVLSKLTDDIGLGSYLQCLEGLQIL